jgi:hypothetical protein
MKGIAFAIATILLVCSTVFAQLPGLSGPQQREPGQRPGTPAFSFTFYDVYYPHDTFTQLLGMNTKGLIAGYHGATINKGFTLFLTTFYPENYPGSVQTQVTGINNDTNTETSGFYIDTAGINHGFLHNSDDWWDVDFPGTNFNQLLGLNDNNTAAGYYMDGIGNFHPYIYEQAGDQFEELNVPFTLSAQATDINNNGEVVGFYLDGSGVSHGWEEYEGTYHVFNYPGSTSTQILGINNYFAPFTAIVGSFTDASGTHGFLCYYVICEQIDAPGGVGETIVNGINDNFGIVGFINTSSTVNTGFIGIP